MKPDETATRPSLRRRVTRWFKIATIGVVLFVGLLLLTLVLFFSSETGKDYVIQTGLNAANEALPGKIRLNKASIHWFSSIDLLGLELLTPTDEPLISVSRILVHYRLLDLLFGEANIALVQLEAPSVIIAYDDSGQSNLDRFLGPSTEKPEPETESPPWDGRLPLEVNLEQLKIINGHVVMTDAREATPEVVALDSLNLEAGYHSADALHTVSLTPLSLNLTTPPLGETTLETVAIYDRSRGEDEIELRHISLSAPGINLKGVGEMADFETPRGKITLNLQRLDTALIKKFVPDLPIKDNVALDLHAELDHNQQASLDLTLKLPLGSMSTKGTLDLAKLETNPDDLGYDLALTTNELRVDSILDMDLPPLNPLNLKLTMKGRGISPETMKTGYKLVIDPITYQGYVFKGGRLSGRIDEGLVIIEKSLIESPYASLAVNGLINLDGPVRADAQIRIDDLSRLGSQLDIPIKGDAQISAHVTGNFTRPDIHYALVSERFTYGEGDEVLAKARDIKAEGDFHLTEKDGETGYLATANLTGADLGTSETFLSSFAVEARYDGDIYTAIEAIDRTGRPIRLAAFVSLTDNMRIDVKDLDLPLGTGGWTLQSPFTVTMAGEDIEVDSFLLEGDDGKLEGGGIYRPQGVSDVHLEARGILLDNFVPFSPESLAGLHGRLGLKAAVKGEPTAPDVSARIDVAHLRSDTIPEVDGNIQVTTTGAEGSRTAVQADLSLKKGGTISARVNLPIALTMAGISDLVSDVPAAGTLRIRKLNLEQLAPLGGPDTEQLSGTLNTRAHLEGTLNDLRLRLDLDGQEITAIGPTPIDINARLAYTNKGLEARAAIALSKHRVPHILVAQFEVPLELTKDFEPVLHWEEPVQGRLKMVAQSISNLAPLYPELDHFKGTVALDGVISGTLAAPDIDFQFHARDLQPPAYPPSSLDLEMAYAGERAAVLLRAQIADTKPSYAEARVDIPLGKVLQGGELDISNLKAAIDVTQLDLMTIPAVMRGPQVKSGKLDLQMSFESPSNIPTFRIFTAVSGLSVGDDLHDISIAGTFAEENMSLDINIATAMGPEARITGDIPLQLELPINGSDTVVEFPQGLNIAASFPGLNLNLANAVMPSGMTLQGELSGEATISGALDAPALQGKLTLADGSFFYPSEGVFYDQIAMSVDLTPNLITLSDTSLRGGKGSLSLKGSVSMIDNSPDALALDVKMEKFEVTNGPYGHILVNGDLNIGGTAGFPDINGDLTIPSAVIKLPDFTSTLVKQLSGLEKSKEIAPTELPPTFFVVTSDKVVTWKKFSTGEDVEEVPFYYNADVLIHMPRDFWIQNESQEVVMEIKGDLRYLSEKGLSRIEGDVETVRGELNLFSEPLIVKQGTITFTGGADIDPRLDIQTEADMGQYGIVSLKIEGPSSEPDIQFGSENGYEESDVLALLIIGKPLSESNNPNDNAKIASEMESLAAGLLAGMARKQIANKLPIDFLEIKADSFSSANLRIGKYITPKLFVSYKRKLEIADTEEENTNEVRAEYQLTKDLYLETFYGDASIWGGEVNWRKYY